jgi:precorrin-2 dehydrogenase / sirohydrochlorin ferrochelatase
MLPVVVNPRMVRIGLAGDGEGLARRAGLLKHADTQPIPVAADADAEALQGLSLLFVAGIGRPEKLAQRAREAGVLVNVEDRPELCDFHVPAVVRRGDLVLTVSTGGRSPGVARRLREWLERRFGDEWDSHLGELGAARTRWRAEGTAPGEISDRTRRMIDEKGWLP